MMDGGIDLGQIESYVPLCFAANTKTAMDSLLGQQSTIIGGFTCIHILDLRHSIVHADIIFHITCINNNLQFKAVYSWVT